MSSHNIISMKRDQKKLMLLFEILLKNESFQLEENLDINKISQKVKETYKKLADKMENQKKMEDLFLKVDYEKNLLVILFSFFKLREYF